MVMSRFIRRPLRSARTILRAMLTLCPAFWLPGCGVILPAPPGLPAGTPLADNHPVRQALAGSAFADPLVLQVDRGGARFRLVFAESTRSISGSFLPGTGELNELCLARDEGSARICFDPATRQVVFVETSGGGRWGPAKLSDARAIVKDGVASYLAANRELLALENSQAAKSSNSLLSGELAFLSTLFLCPLCPVFQSIFAVVVAISTAVTGPAGPAPVPVAVPPGGPATSPSDLLPTDLTPPTPADDTAATVKNVAVVIDVLANDVEPADGLAPSTVAVTFPPVTGRAIADPSSGTITYVPSLNFVGTETFTYQVCDNGTPRQCAAAVVSVTVSADEP
jgi:hypothetical protein